MQLSTLLADERLDLTLAVAPEDPDSVRLTWVHTTEIRDPRPWLDGGELLLTTGANLATSPQGVSAYVRRLQEAGTAALGFGIRPYHDVPPAALERACRRWGLPLLVVPDSTPFIAVSRAVGDWWADWQNREVTHAAAVQRRLARAVLAPDPVAEVVDRLARGLACWVLLRVGRSVTTAGEVPPEARAHPASRAAERVAAGSTSLHGHSVITRRLTLPAGKGSLLVGRDRPFTDLERSVLLVAEDLVTASATAPRQRVDTSALGAMAFRLLAGGQVDLGWELVAALLGDVLPHGAWVVVAVSGPSGPAGPSPEDGSSPHGSAVHGVYGGVDTWLVPEPALPDLVASLTGGGSRCGYSEPLPPAAVEAGFPQARRALRVAAAGSRTGTAVGPDDLRGRGPLALAGPQQVSAAEQLLAPLLDGPRGATLARTLQSWLDVHGHWDRTAQHLGVHRHTVKQRVDQAFAVIGRHPENPRDRFEVWFALELWSPSTSGVGSPPSRSESDRSAGG